MQNLSDAAILADSAITVSRTSERQRPFTLDTTFVLFFLAMEMGQSAFGLDVETLMSAATLAAFVILPYLLPYTREGRSFALWMAGRIAVGSTGLLCGWVIGNSAGALMPEAIRYVPLTLLIVAAIICCNFQIYGILKNRLAS